MFMFQVANNRLRMWWPGTALIGITHYLCPSRASTSTPDWIKPRINLIEDNPLGPSEGFSGLRFRGPSRPSNGPQRHQLHSSDANFAFGLSASKGNPFGTLPIFKRGQGQSERTAFFRQYPT